MTAAVDFPPIVLVPDSRRLGSTAPRRGAGSVARSVIAARGRHDEIRGRLTGRGRLLLAAVLTALACAVVLAVAVLSAPPGAPDTSGGPGGVRDVRAVTVQPGDTLWSIAVRVAPERDPRAEIDELVRRNGLTAAVIEPGQVLSVP